MPASFRVSIRADRDGVAKVSAAFADFAEAHAVSDGVRRGMAVALDELLSNTVSYGTADDGSEVTVEGKIVPGKLIITVTDSGRPFDPLSQMPPDTSLSVEDRPMGGLGIHLVRQLVDDVRYERRSDRNVVVLTKRT